MTRSIGQIGQIGQIPACPISPLDKSRESLNTLATMPGGRPPSYNTQTAELVCSWIASGGSVHKLCQQPEAPAWPTLWAWINGRNGAPEDFAIKYAQAREAQYESWAHQILDIADEPAPDMAAVTRARLRVDTRKWLLSKLLPKQYGDKVGVEVSGSIDLLALVEASMKVRAPVDESPLIEGEVNHDTPS